MLRRLFVLSAAGALAACGGGAHSALVPAPSASPAAAAPASGPKQTATFTIRLPAPPGASSSNRSPKYISYSTKSLEIDIDPGTSSQSDQSFDLTTQSGNCAPTGVLGVLQCSLPISISVGSHSSNLIAYDATGGTAGGGKILSAAYGVPVTIVAGMTNTPTFTLGGVPASFVVVPLDGTALRGDGVTQPLSFTSAAAAQILVEALDADKNPIIGPASPTITAVSGNASAIAVSQNTSNPYQFQVQPLAAAASPVTVTFSAPDTTNAGHGPSTFAATFAPPFTPQLTCASVTCVDAAVGTDSVSVTESGYSGAFTFSSASSVAGQCAIAGTAPASAYVTATASSNTTCTITATDASSRSAARDIRFPSVLTQSVNGSAASAAPAPLNFTCFYYGSCITPTSWRVFSTAASPAYAWVASSIAITYNPSYGDICIPYQNTVLVQMSQFTAAWALYPPITASPYTPYIQNVSSMTTKYADTATCTAQLTDGFGGYVTVNYTMTVTVSS